MPLMLLLLQPCRVTTFMEMCGPTTCNPGGVGEVLLMIIVCNIMLLAGGVCHCVVAGILHLLVPILTYCNVSFSWSLCLAVKCRCLTDNNYAWIEWHRHFVSSATYRIIVCSVVWMGWSTSHLYNNFGMSGSFELLLAPCFPQLAGEQLFPGWRQPV